MQTLRHVIFAGIVLAVAESSAYSQIIYNFEAPNFFPSQSTPINNVAPNIGIATFLTTFTSSPVADGFHITGGGAPNSLFTGQHLINPLPTPASLTLNFNQPVLSFSVDYALINAGYLRLMDGATTLDQPSMPFVGGFPGGTLNYNNPLGFQSVTLTGFTLGNTIQQLAIDDLVLIPVPEPGSFILAVLGFAAGWRMGRHRQPVSIKCSG